MTHAQVQMVDSGTSKGWRVLSTVHPEVPARKEELRKERCEGLVENVIEPELSLERSRELPRDSAESCAVIRNC